MPWYRGPETERLILRAATVDDAPALYVMNSDPEVMRYTGEPMPASVDVMRKMIADYPDFERHGYGRWVCEEKATGEVIGFAGLKYLEDFGEVDVGYRLRRTWWGRGLATEAARACLDFGFEAIGLEEIVAFVEPENAASVRVAEKLGMQLAGPFDYDGTPCLRYVRRRR
ncbi:MAG: GNAT family N-acetyltransferase [Deltaproteobacteria bacterium]